MAEGTTHAAAPVHCPESEESSRLALALPGSDAATRKLMRQLREILLARNLTEDTVHTTELVLAEVLNNIVEHAYASGPGPIRLTLSHCPGWLGICVRDQGRPLPRELLQGDGTPAPEHHAQDLPEGGFGWHLIRSLTQDLHYQREGEENLLSFRIALKAPPAHADQPAAATDGETVKIE